jgi:hypothetical protein
MLRVSLREWLEVGARASDCEVLFGLLEDDDSGPSGALGIAAASGRRKYKRVEEMRDGERVEFVEFLRHLSQMAESLNLTTTARLLTMVANDPPETQRELKMVVVGIKADLDGKVCLCVPEHLAKYYENDALMDEQTANAFPAARKELRLAANSVACGLSTAAIFHAMRAAEIGVRILGKELGVTFPNKPIALAECQQILDQADSKIKAIGQQPKSEQRDEDQRFFSSAAAQFRYFKDAWRARAAHARASFDETEALRVLDHALDFFRTLSERLAE